mmetsp:Transcript_137819/g.250623  ORF Transcript_137819/g.250623 Transcript_137819/m.250623 type:complete len:603 (+) Transcript_137819:69-1877(+)
MVHSGFNKVHHASFFTVQLRAEDPHAEDKSEWVDLLYDLVFVAFAFAMSSTISHSELTLYNNFVFFFFVTYFWSSWLFVTNIRNTYTISGMLHYIAIVSNMIGHAGCSAELDAELLGRHHFAYWRLLIIFSEVIITIAIVHQCPRGRSWVILIFFCYLVPSILCCVVFIALPYTDDDDEENWRHWVCSITFGSMSALFWGSHLIFYYVITCEFIKPPPFSYSLYMMRLEEVTMILLGETFIAVVAMNLGHSEQDIRICGVVCMVLVFCAGSWYFATQPHNPHDHPIAQPGLRGCFAFVLYRALGTVVFFFGCYVKTTLFLMQPKGGGHRRLSSAASGSSASSQGSGQVLGSIASSASSVLGSVASASSHGSSASSSPATTSHHGSSHGSGGNAGGHGGGHAELGTAAHLLLICYIFLMLIINTAMLLQKFHGDARTWKLNVTLASMRYVLFLALFGLWPLGDKPVAMCFSLLGAEMLNIAVGFVFVNTMRKPMLHDAKVHPESGLKGVQLVHPESPLIARADDALTKLHEAAEAAVVLKKAIDEKDAHKISKILTEDPSVTKLIGNRRKPVFGTKGAAASTDDVADNKHFSAAAYESKKVAD